MIGLNIDYHTSVDGNDEDGLRIRDADIFTKLRLEQDGSPIPAEFYVTVRRNDVHQNLYALSFRGLANIVVMMAPLNVMIFLGAQESLEDFEDQLRSAVADVPVH